MVMAHIKGYHHTIFIFIYSNTQQNKKRLFGLEIPSQQREKQVVVKENIIITFLAGKENWYIFLILV